MSSYLNVVYNENIRPKTDYPFQLAKYLFRRFDMKKGDRLLDVGCGRGELVKGFKELGLQASGLDREKSDIEVKLVDIERGDFPFQDKTFDFIFSKSLIEHLRNPENFIKESYRVLKLGGKIIVMTPDWQSQRYIFYNDYTHVHPYTKTGIKNLLKIYSFKEVTSEVFYQLPVLWKHPWLKIFSKFLQLSGPVKKIHKNKFVRWSKELMILGAGVK